MCAFVCVKERESESESESEWSWELEEMKESNDGFVRADQIDLTSLDEQLERHLNRACTMEKNKKK